jgi:uncharacterized protein (TIGR00369 family)
MTKPLIDPRFHNVTTFIETGIPFNRHLGMKIVFLQEGHCVLHLPFVDHIVGDPVRGILHGGVTSALIDACGGSACFTMLTSYRDRISTVDMRVDFLNPAPGADTYCEAKVVRMGNRVAVARMEVFSGGCATVDPEADVTLIATGQAVYNVVRHKPAPRAKLDSDPTPA